MPTDHLEKYPAESTLFDLNCTAVLAAGETVTGTPIMSFLPALTGGDALTLGSPVVNTTSITYDDGTQAAIGKVIQLLIGGGSALATGQRRTYSVIATFTTSSGYTKVARANLDVLSLLPSC